MPPVAFYNIKIASSSKSIEKSVLHDLERKQKGSKSRRRAGKTSLALSLRNLTLRGERERPICRGKQIRSMEDELVLDLRPLAFIKTPGHGVCRIIESRGRP